ncbi:MAG: nitrous oxide reductase accessory protein NosL, partial [Pseudomonadota bacterium]
IIVLVLACALTVTGAYAAGKGGAVPPNAKCPVCGMFVSKYPDWTATASFKDGTTHYFDGPKDLLTYYLEPTRYARGRRQADIASMTVKEYYSLGMIDPRGAFFVLGSDVYGPMGSELIPFKTQKDAMAFKIDHKGKRIIRFNEITSQLIKTLN